jgi:hypothetical protein
MNITCKCGHKYKVPLIPCPDGIEDCLVVHTRTEDYICPECEANNMPNLSHGIYEDVGMGFGNIEAVKRLELWSDEVPEKTQAVVKVLKDGPQGPPVLDLTKNRRGVAGTINKMYVDNDALEALFGPCARVPIGGIVHDMNEPPNAFTELASDQFEDNDLIVINHEVHFGDGSVIKEEQTLTFAQVMPFIEEE